MTGRRESKHKYIYDKARNYCAYQERSAFDVKKKLNEWKVRPEISAQVIRSLKEENYLDEERFARVFAGGKFRIKKWGRNKITAELRARRIPDTLIQLGLKEIDENEYDKTLKEIIEKKSAAFSDPQSIEVKKKILNFVLSRGFEKYLILEKLH